MGMERRQWWPMVEWVKRERLREGRHLRTMGGGVRGLRIQLRRRAGVDDGVLDSDAVAAELRELS